MSMIGNSLLNQIINEKGITQPAAILEQLNLSVIESLQQSENDSTDGMDVAICALDSENCQVTFAGANRPLWHVSEGKLDTYKPDKLPIGGLQVGKERKFQQLTIPMVPGDTIYLFTDGYADQFGGTHGKKMMTSRFREQVQHIQHHEMAEQESYLRGYFERWRGENEQVDDVLVIGLKVGKATGEPHPII
jgi:serine phosphatase RsbU (regulator of sigma subunit)